MAKKKKVNRAPTRDALEKRIGEMSDANSALIEKVEALTKEREELAKECNALQERNSKLWTLLSHAEGALAIGAQVYSVDVKDDLRRASLIFRFSELATRFQQLRHNTFHAEPRQFILTP